MNSWLLRLGTLLPLGLLTWGVVTLNGWNHPARLDPQTVRASRPLLLACEADLRRNHPRERPFQLSLRQYETVENEVAAIMCSGR